MNNQAVDKFSRLLLLQFLLFARTNCSASVNPSVTKRKFLCYVINFHNFNQKLSSESDDFIACKMKSLSRDFYSASYIHSTSNSRCT